MQLNSETFCDTWCLNARPRCCVFCEHSNQPEFFKSFGGSRETSELKTLTTCVLQDPQEALVAWARLQQRRTMHACGFGPLWVCVTVRAPENSREGPSAARLLRITATRLQALSSCQRQRTIRKVPARNGVPHFTHPGVYGIKERHGW